MAEYRLNVENQGPALPAELIQHATPVDGSLVEREEESPIDTWELIGESALDSFLRNNAVRIALPPIAAARLERLNGELDKFLRLAPEIKQRYTSGEQDVAGYRQPEHAFTIDPSTGVKIKDKNPSFLYWRHSESEQAEKQIQHADEIPDLISAARDYYEVSAALTRGLLRALSRHFNRPGEIRFEMSSHLQANLPVDELSGILKEGDEVQGEHEDGTLLTIITATDPGLAYVAADGTRTNIDFASGEVLIMAGCLAEVMMNKAAAFWHQALYWGDFSSDQEGGSAGRKAIMLFVSPDPDEYGRVYPLTTPEGTTPLVREAIAFGLGKLVLTNPSVLFGQPEDFISR